ncbi:hypothetical protein GH714_005322 [Hevea brasiliensis]|uniref:EF-hand domain-containing protein n=1 Tax=Hevea brasiliensis TaxID=3981 RepID=A0A6A6M9B3_HEVBR|nr:hypothetical protein GH714_005322 [Hevea brasiliensis]
MAIQVLHKGLSPVPIRTMEDFKKWLKTFDADKDGRISRKEFENAIHGLDGVWFAKLQAWLQVHSADTNRNGFIDEDELDNLLNPRGPAPTQKRQVCGMYDLDPFNMINAKFDALTNVLAKKMEDLSMLVSSSSSSGSSQQVAMQRELPAVE